MVWNLNMVKKGIIITIIILVITSNFQAVYAEIFFPSTNVRLKGPSTYCVITPTDEILQEKGIKWVKLTKDAIQDWENNLKIAEIENDSIWEMAIKETSSENDDECDVRIEFRDKPELSDTVAGYFSWPPGKIVIYYLQPKLCNMIIPCYDDKTLKSDDAIYAIALHEMGHSLGLDHYVSDDNDVNKKWQTANESPPSVMIPTIPRISSLLQITDIDIQKVREIYGRDGFYAFVNSPIPKPQPTPEPTPEPVIPLSPFTAMNISENTIEADRYDRQIVTLSGRIADEEFYRGLPVIITVHKPDDSVEVLKIKTTGKGYFETLLIIDKNSIRGVYHISASYIGHVDRDMNISFQVIDRQIDSSTAKAAPKTNELSGPSSEKFNSKDSIKIPNWVKNNAKWWATERIGDQAFISSIQYLIEQKIILIPNTTETTQNFREVPLWVKNIAGFWAENAISDDEFVKSIQFLVGNGIIVVP